MKWNKIQFKLQKCLWVNVINPPLTSAFPSPSSSIDGLGTVAWLSAGGWATICLSRSQRIALKLFVVTGDKEWLLRGISRYELSIRREPASWTTLAGTHRPAAASLGHTPPLKIYTSGRFVTVIWVPINTVVKMMNTFFLMTHRPPCSEISVFYCHIETISNHFLHLILIVLKN